MLHPATMIHPATMTTVNPTIKLRLRASMSKGLTMNRLHADTNNKESTRWRRRTREAIEDNADHPTTLAYLFLQPHLPSKIGNDEAFTYMKSLRSNRKADNEWRRIRWNPTNERRRSVQPLWALTSQNTLSSTSSRYEILKYNPRARS